MLRRECAAVLLLCQVRIRGFNTAQLRIHTVASAVANCTVYCAWARACVGCTVNHLSARSRRRRRDRRTSRTSAPTGPGGSWLPRMTRHLYKYKYKYKIYL